MLNRSKLIGQLHKVADQLFIDHSVAYKSVQEVWRAIIQDTTFLYKVRQVAHSPWPVPLWEDALNRIIPVMPFKNPYYALSVDGSQIYPDRHNILSCFLINTGSVVVPYGMQGCRVELISEPTVFAGIDEDGLPFTADTVNCKRQELELASGLELAVRINTTCASAQSVLFFDGSLIFWHLSSQHNEIRDRFLNIYLTQLDQLCREKIITAWYISLPKSKELMSLVRLYLCNFDHKKTDLYSHVDAMVDSAVINGFLPSFTRSIVFSNHSSVSAFYPAHVRPFFFYINIGVEIGRVEIPAWIAQDEALVDYVASVLLDQCIKGGGYPVVLAEAHEQAVVKGPDRDFFYHFLQKMIIERKQSVAISRKSLKKRGMGI